ncbi:cholesterol oxidase substrate-binding domain-containing protein [Arthrobacter russicus]|uniref:cholesterol oxidase substrate-binding domain-containing protein n=1 Tax=Arthrobacter russicus TaxID=172040 RepID=UPI003CEC452D
MKNQNLPIENLAGGLNRRGFLGATAAAAGGFVFLGYEAPANAAAGPAAFPKTIPLYREVYKNWDEAIVSDALWTCAPTSSADVVRVVNWAHSQGYRVRARGYRHSWSPLTVAGKTPGSDKVILVDTTKSLTGMQLAGDRLVTVQAGASMLELLTYLAAKGYGLTAAPAPGDISVAGALAINGHGTAVPGAGESSYPGQGFGTLSNLVVSVKAIVWDETQNAYAERRFDRTDPECSALLTHLGRSFLTEVTLQVVDDYNVRCRNYTDIDISELFAHPDRMTSRSLSRLIDGAGRVGIIWYAFTDRPWVQIWEVSPNRPWFSRKVVTPFNYPFADNLPTPVPQLLGELVEGNPQVAPKFCAAILAATEAGLTLSGARDMWGKSKNLIHFVKPTTLRVTAGSHAVITRRDQVQRVVHDFTTFYNQKLAEYQAANKFPINSGLEIRVTGLDDPRDTGIPGAQPAALSAALPVPGRPDWDTAVWLDVLTLPDTPDNAEFYMELVDYFHRFDPALGLPRPEWAKRWAHTPQGPWTDRKALKQQIPAAFPQWESAVATLAKHDPAGLYRNPLLDELFG